jgi:hypothetical protein
MLMSHIFNTKQHFGSKLRLVQNRCILLLIHSLSRVIVRTSLRA